MAEKQVGLGQALQIIEKSHGFGGGEGIDEDGVGHDRLFILRPGRGLFFAAGGQESTEG